MNMTQLAILAISTIVLSYNAVAGQIDPRLAKYDMCGPYEIYHINGITTTRDEALRNRDALSGAYGNAHEEHLIKYNVAYNRTAGALRDLIDVFNQKRGEYPAISVEVFAKALLFGVVQAPLTTPIVADIRKALAARVISSGETSYSDADLHEIVAAVRSVHRPAGRVLLVPHSQGNLYANLAYDRLTSGSAPTVQTKSIAIVGVATPASSVRGGGKYVTSTLDVVIGALRSALPVLPPNVTQPFTLDDALGHNFIKIYLRPNTPGRASIVANMEAALRNLKSSVDADPFYGGPVDSFYYYSAGTWKNAGPGPGWPGPANDDNGALWTTPFVGASVPGEYRRSFSAGGPGGALSAAKSSLKACYSRMISAIKAQRTSSTGSGGVILPVCPDNTDGFDFTAWGVYSADFSTSESDSSDYVYAGRHYSTYAEAYLVAACRR